MGFTLYNLMSCRGFVDGHAGTGLDFGPCFQAKVFAVLLFFIIAITRKWAGEEMGYDFSILWGQIFGLGAFLLVITFTGSPKIAFAVGLVAGLSGGYGAGFLGLGGETE